MSARVSELDFTRRLYLWGARGDVFPIDQADPAPGRPHAWGRVSETDAALPAGFYRLDDRDGEFRVWSTSGSAPADKQKSILHPQSYVGEFLYAASLSEAREAKRLGDAAIAEADRRSSDQ